MRRGELWRYEPVMARAGQSTLRLIVSADVLLEAQGLPTVYAMHVVDSDPGSLLAVEMAPHGWAFALQIDRPPRSRLVELIDAATREQMDAVDNALRATFDL